MVSAALLDFICGLFFVHNLLNTNFVDTSGGPLAALEFCWTIDTIAPTALMDGGQAFTNEENVLVNITFRELCSGFIYTNVPVM